MTSTTPAKEMGTEERASSGEDSDSPAADAPGSGSAAEKTAEKKREEIRKTLASLPSSEAKLEALVAKHAVASEEGALAKKNLKSARRATGAVIRERDVLKAELEKAMLGKAKLEGICREFQTTNKTIKQENLAALREQETKRQELADQFKASLAEIEAGMGAGKERSEKLYRENQRLAAQLDALAEKYAAKEEQGAKLADMREASAQLLEAKLGQAQARLDALSAESLGDKESLIGKLQEREAQIAAMIDVEEKLRKQLEDYGQRYAAFQDNFSSTNQSFQRFQAQMDETKTQLGDAIAQNAHLTKELKEQLAKTATLEKLTRALQDERVGLIKELTHLKETPPTLTSPVAPRPASPSNKNNSQSKTKTASSSQKR